MPETPAETDAQLSRAKINAETAKIPWKELQRYFASGKTLYVDASLDLVDVAFAFQQDNTQIVDQWLNQKHICEVTTRQAKNWIKKDAIVWAAVVKPWVLIQEIR